MHLPEGRQIRIGKQTFDTPAQNEFCENLAFTPWHGHVDHRPLAASIGSAKRSTRKSPRIAMRGTDSPATASPPGLHATRRPGMRCARHAGRNCAAAAATANDVFDDATP